MGESLVVLWGGVANVKRVIEDDIDKKSYPDKMSSRNYTIPEQRVRFGSFILI